MDGFQKRTSEQDFTRAHGLYEYLLSHGVAAWLDKDRLVLGDNWASEIKKAVVSADVFVVCLRPGFDEIGFGKRK